jgi:hypothetical protein
MLGFVSYISSPHLGQATPFPTVLLIVIKVVELVEFSVFKTPVEEGKVILPSKGPEYPLYVLSFFIW